MEEEEAGTEIERFGVTRLFFIENNPMFPCWYSHTNTPTASRPLTEHLDRGDKSFRKKKEPTRARVCARRMRRLVERRKN